MILQYQARPAEMVSRLPAPANAPPRGCYGMLAARLLRYNFTRERLAR